MESNFNNLIEEVDGMVDDFGAGVLTDAPLATNKLLEMISAILAFGPGPVAALGDVFGLAAAFAPDEEKELEKTADGIKRGIKERLIATNRAHVAAVEEEVKMLLGGKGDITKLSMQTSPNNEKNPIAKVFAGGKFVRDVTEDGQFDTLIEASFGDSLRMIKPGLVGSLFNSLGYIIAVLVSRKATLLGVACI